MRPAVVAVVVIAGLIMLSPHSGAASSGSSDPPRLTSIVQGLHEAEVTAGADVKAEEYDSIHRGSVGYCYDLYNNVDYDFRDNVGRAVADGWRDRIELSRQIAVVHRAISSLKVDVNALANNGAPRTGTAKLIVRAMASISTAEARADSDIARLNRYAGRAWTIAIAMAGIRRCPAADRPQHKLRHIPRFKVLQVGSKRRSTARHRAGTSSRQVGGPWQIAPSSSPGASSR
jgi:hypothetical protein